MATTYDKFITRKACHSPAASHGLLRTLGLGLGLRYYRALGLRALALAPLNSYKAGTTVTLHAAAESLLFLLAQGKYVNPGALSRYVCSLHATCHLQGYLL